MGAPGSWEWPAQPRPASGLRSRRSVRQRSPCPSPCGLLRHVHGVSGGRATQRARPLTKPDEAAAANDCERHVSHPSALSPGKSGKMHSLSRTTMKIIVHPRHTNLGATRISLSTSHRTCGHEVAATQTKREEARWGWCARRTNGCRTRSQWVRGTRRARRRRIPASGVLPQHPACTREGQQSSTPTSARWPSPESSRPRDWRSGSPA